MEEMTVLKRIVLLVTILLDLFLFVIGIEALTPFFYSHKTLFSIIPSLWIYYLFVDVGSWYCIGIPLSKR